MLIESTTLLVAGIDANHLLGFPDLQIYTVDTALEAAEYLAHHNPQFLLVDARLLDALRRLDISALPIITVVHDETQGEQTIWQGAQAYILHEDLNRQTLRYVFRHVLESLMLQNTLHEVAQQTLEHEMRFRNLIARNVDGMVVIDHQGIMRFVNPAAAALFGRTDTHMLGQHFILPFEINVLSQHDLLRPSGFVTRVELRVIEIEWMHKPAYLASLHDISTHQRMEQRLLEAAYENSIFATAINRLVVGVLITSREDDEHRIVYVNPAFSAITGYLSEDVLGKDPSLLQGPETDPTQVLAMNDALAAERPFEGVILNYRKDGTPFWNKLSVNPVFDAHGVLINWVGLVTDFTPIVEAEAQLKKERDFSSAIIDTAGSLIIVTDARGSVVRVNPAYEAITGYPLAQTDAALVHALIYAGDASQALSALAQGTALQPVLGEHLGTMPAHDGRTLRILWRSTALYNASHEIEYIIITGLDITERERAAEAQLEKESLRIALDKQRELNELKSRFMSMISHELRTPLATIIMATDLLKDYRERFSAEEIDRRLNQIQGQVVYLTDLMEDMLVINRAETVGLDFNPSLIEIETFCREIVQEILYGDMQGNQIHFSSAQNCGKVLLDPKLMRQVLVNLLSNAIKYSRQPAHVELELECSDHLLTLRVRDQGIGIPPHDLPRLFQTFQRASNVSGISGTGIGLAIVKYVVELHSGTVSVDSQLNVGTTFTIALPRSRV
ncbi:MAG: PAS domain S-box protein [Anaerolineae bacterium]